MEVCSPRVCRWPSCKPSVLTVMTTSTNITTVKRMGESDWAVPNVSGTGGKPFRPSHSHTETWSRWGNRVSGLYAQPVQQSDPGYLRQSRFPALFLFFSSFAPCFHPSHPLIPVMTTRGWTCHSAGLSPLLPPPAVFTESRKTCRPWSNKKTPWCASGQWGRRGVWCFFCSVIKSFSSYEHTLGRCCVRGSSLCVPVLHLFPV